MRLTRVGARVGVMIRTRLTYANVVASLALFLALGGAAFAATQLPRNSVGTGQLKTEAVTAGKIAKKTRNQLRGPAALPALRVPRVKRARPGRRVRPGPKARPVPPAREAPTGPARRSKSSPGKS